MRAREQFWTTAIIAGVASGYAFASDPSGVSAADTAVAGREAASDQSSSVSISRRIVDSAGAFERYFRSASAVMLNCGPWPLS